MSNGEVPQARLDRVVTQGAGDRATGLEGCEGSPDALSVLRSIGEALYEWDIATDTLRWGPNAPEVLQVTDPAAIASGRRFARLAIPGNLMGRFDAVTASGGRDEGRGVPYQIEYGLSPVPGTTLWVEDSGRWFAGPDGLPARAHGAVRVITERHARESRLQHLARHDGLTGEMNRRALIDALQATLDEALRYRSSCAFLIVSIDDLGRINDSYGFDIGDEAVAAVGRRLRAKMRSVDSLGRFSGNKFGVILKSASLDDMAVAADRLLATIREDVIRTSVGSLVLTGTIGGVIAPRHGGTVHDVIARAQDALETAKRRRRGSFEPYRPSPEREELRKSNARASDEIIAALNERRIVLAYEPVMQASTRQTAFYECLIRITQPDGALVGAAGIIPAAERLGLVRLLDQRMLELVLAELAATPDLEASVNVSPASIVDPDWWGCLEAHARLRAEAASRLILEITETTAIQNVEETQGFVSRAKALGCRIAIDDFGAGYTSFRNLRRLGVDMIKIDGAFVQNMFRSHEDRIFVRTMIELGRGLGLATVAEWVQDEKTAALLADLGCDFLQGRLAGCVSLQRPGHAGTADSVAGAVG